MSLVHTPPLSSLQQPLILGHFQGSLLELPLQEVPGLSESGYLLLCRLYNNVHLRHSRDIGVQLVICFGLFLGCRRYRFLQSPLLLLESPDLGLRPL
jgi:hypothetical protein